MLQSEINQKKEQSKPIPNVFIKLPLKPYGDTKNIWSIFLLHAPQYKFLATT